MDKVEERISELMQYVDHSITFVEAKHGSFIALCLVFLIGIIENFMGSDCLCKNLLVAGLLFFLIASLLTSLYAFYPKQRFTGRDSIPEESNITHLFRCENLETYKPEDLMRKLSEGVEDHVFDDFEKEKIDKIICASKSAARKYRLFRRALSFFVYFIVLFVITLILQLLTSILKP